MEGGKKFPPSIIICENAMYNPAENFFDASVQEKLFQTSPLSARMRPRSLDEYIGQESLKRQIKRAIASAKAREASLEHILLYGPP